MKPNENNIADKQRELDTREKELEEREAKVLGAETAQKKRLRDGLYDKISLSVKALDLIIGGVIALLVILIVVGIILGMQ